MEKGREWWIQAVIKKEGEMAKNDEDKKDGKLGYQTFFKPEGWIFFRDRMKAKPRMKLYGGSVNEIQGWWRQEEDDKREKRQAREEAGIEMKSKKK